MWIVEWKKPETVNWQDIFKSSRSILVYGKRSSLKDDCFQEEHWGHVCGTIHTLGDDRFVIESIQGATTFLIKNIKMIAVLPELFEEA